VKPKIYKVEIVKEATKALIEAPALPPKSITHSETIQELTPYIKELHKKKNYDARSITKMLKEKSIKITLKEVKNITETEKKSR
jgi:hypothetical protein